MPRLYSRLLFIVALVFCLGADTDPDGRLFQSSVDPLADVQQALGRADDGDKLALVVLGANWCHDSRALASRLHRLPLAELIQQPLPRAARKPQRLGGQRLADLYKSVAVADACFCR